MQRNQNHPRKLEGTLAAGSRKWSLSCEYRNVARSSKKRELSVSGKPLDFVICLSSALLLVAAIIAIINNIFQKNSSAEAVAEKLVHISFLIISIGGPLTAMHMMKHDHEHQRKRNNKKELVSDKPTYNSSFSLPFFKEYDDKFSSSPPTENVSSTWNNRI